MTITIYPDGHSIQQGTPEELARLVFEMQALKPYRVLEIWLKPSRRK